MELTLNSGTTKTKINEFPIDASSASLYNPDGVDVAYGFGGEKRYMYGALDSSSAEFAFGGKEHSAGLHNVNLSRPLVEGEEIHLIWRNGYQLVVFYENGATKVKKPVGGSYQEIGKWASVNGNSENTCIKFNDDVSTKRFDYIETREYKEF